MSMPTLSPLAEHELSHAVLAALRADPDLQADFGTPARIYDDETRRAPYPNTALEGWSSEPADTASRRGAAQTATFVVQSRYGGHAEARRLVGALRASLDRLEIDLPTQRVILVQTVFTDVMRTADLQQFRGVVRVRFVVDGGAS